MDAQLLGALGESYAAAYYRNHGYSLCAANYRTRFGEVDLIAEKKHTLIFIEVKTRRAGAMVSGSEAVTPEKQRRIILAAQEYIACYFPKRQPRVRFDVVEVTQQPDGTMPVRCIENAFTC